MRLLQRRNTSDLDLTSFDNEALPPYAILSHMWGAEDEEVTFKDLINGTGKHKVGYGKIMFCAEQAAADNLEYFWVDTCCVNKANHAEMSYSINSMFQWFHNATRCYVYLTDVSTAKQKSSSQSSKFTWESAFRKSRWFTRAWTLQELLAPGSVEFFSREGDRLGDRISLAKQIHQITGIPRSALQGAPLSQFSVNERLSWMENRESKIEEDEAYSLLGIFDVYMSPIYGEGRKRAFERLMCEIGKLEDEDTEIKSFVDSGYGTTSTTSSVYSIANVPEAREDVLALLLQDEELQVLFSSAFDKVNASKFEHNFRIMLGQFARELRNEAQDSRERSVAYVMRTIAGYVSNSICKKYSIGTDMRAKEMDQLSSQLPEKRQLLERLLNPKLTDTKDSQNEMLSADDEGYEAEEDYWDENDMVSLPHLEQLEKFVVNSQAMRNLRKNLRGWINPKHQHSRPLERDQVTAKELPVMQEPDEQEQTVTHLMPNTYDQVQSPWWRLRNTFRRFARASVPMGYRRLEWTCDCGEEIYGDYDNRDPVAVEKLASILQRRTCVTQAIENDSITSETSREQDISGHKRTSNSNDEGGGGSSVHHSGALSSADIRQSGSTQAPASNQAGSTGINDSSSNIQSSSEDSSGTELHPIARKRKFLELCVNTSDIDISLGEIDITDVTSDAELFRRIYERYKNLRGHRMKRFFLKPVNVHFVHFSVQKRHRVGIYGQPLVIPPEDEVKAERYHYEECPLQVQPPMDYRTFLHYMSKHKHGDPANPSGMSLHTDSIFLRRLPKKTGASVLAGQQSTLQFGWGVHIIEGPNKVALSWATFLSLALSFIVSALYAHFWHTQEQGFAIGQWMVAVLSAAIAALYFQWAET